MGCSSCNRHRGICKCQPATANWKIHHDLNRFTKWPAEPVAEPLLLVLAAFAPLLQSALPLHHPSVSPPPAVLPAVKMCVFFSRAKVCKSSFAFSHTQKNISINVDTCFVHKHKHPHVVTVLVSPRLLLIPADQ